MLPPSAKDGTTNWPVQTHHPACKGMAGTCFRAAVVATAMMWSYDWASTSPAPEVSNYTQLTHDGEAKFLAGTDGSRLYLGMEFRAHPESRRCRSRAAIRCGCRHPGEYTFPVGMSPDGTELLAIERQGLDDELSGQAVAVADAQWPTAPDRGSALVTDAAWSPDGAMLAYCIRGDLFLSASDGTAARKLVSLGGIITSPAILARWRRIRFTWQDLTSANRSLWEVTVEGKHLHPLLPGWHQPSTDANGNGPRMGNTSCFKPMVRYGRSRTRLGFSGG